MTGFGFYKEAIDMRHRLARIALAAVLALTTTPLAAETITTRDTTRTITAHTEDASGCLQAFVQGTRVEAGTFVFYNVQDRCAVPAVSLASGVVQIPQGALVVSPSGRTGRIAFTITGAEPDVFGLVGSVNLTLTRTDVWSTESRGTAITHFHGVDGTPDVTLRHQGSRQELSATAHGTFFGYTVTDAGESALATERGLTMNLTR